MSPTLSNVQQSNTSDQQSKNSSFIKLKSYVLLSTFMPEHDAIHARIKPSRWGSHTAAHASVTSLIPLSTACVLHGNDFNCNISAL